LRPLLPLAPKILSAIVNPRINVKLEEIETANMED
jgi:hypothetical protein